MKFDIHSMASLGDVTSLPSGGKDIEIHLGRHSGAASAVWTMADDVRTIKCEEQAQRMVDAWNTVLGLSHEEVAELSRTGGIILLRITAAVAQRRQAELEGAITHARAYLEREAIDGEAKRAIEQILSIAMTGGAQ